MVLPRHYNLPDGLTSREYFKLLKGSDLTLVNPDLPLTPQIDTTSPQIMLEKAAYTILMEIGAYWGHLFLQLETKLSKSTSTAMVGLNREDGCISLLVNPDFFAHLTPSDRVGILYHELQHVALGHLVKHPRKYMERWNVAKDLAINSELVNINPQFMTLPPDSGGGKGNRDDGGDSEPDDGDVSEQDVNIVERALTKAASDAGTAPLYVTEQIQSLRKLRHKRWLKTLQMFLRSSVSGKGVASTWTRPNKRYGFQSSATHNGKGKRLVIGIDTSGSMSKQELEMCLDECYSLLRCGVQATVLVFDTKVHSHGKLKKGYRITECGRGGTAFTEFLEEARNLRADGIVCFTDGDCSEQSLPRHLSELNVLWALTSGDRTGGVVCDVGQKLIIERN